jgi:hypothetical protein
MKVSRFMLAVGLAAAHIAHGEIPAPQTDQKANLRWVRAYLMNAIFTMEYDSVMTSYRQATESTPQLENLEPAADLWARAKLSQLDAKGSGMRRPNGPAVDLLLDEHQRTLKNAPTKTAVGSAVTQGKADVPFLVARVRAGIAEKDRNLLDSLSLGTEKTAGNCTMPFNDVAKFAEHQKSLSQNGENPNALELVEPLRNLDAAKLECLVFAFMGASVKAQTQGGYNPLTLLRAIDQAAVPQGKTEVLRVALAIELLEAKAYSEALGVLVELEESTHSYRLALETVQRIFSIRQQGGGSVAIRAL